MTLYFVSDLPSVHSPSHSDASDVTTDFSSDDDVEYFSPDASDSEDMDSSTLAEDLYSFYVNFNVPVAGMQFLLSSLNKHKVKDAPRSLYLLKKCGRSERAMPIQSLRSGCFTYFGIRENLTLYVDRNGNHNNKELFLSMKANIDGLPLYRSSSTCIWPILVSFGSDIQPYPVAIHLGICKPELDLFLQDFISEIKDLRIYGYTIGNVTVKLTEVFFVCDAPARAYLQCILGHNAKKGCAYCDAEGSYDVDRVVFPSYKGNERTDHKYSCQEESNQVRLSPLSGIVGLKSHFPIDDLHCVCLGVYRKVCHFLFSKSSKSSGSCRVRDADIVSLSDEIMRYRKYTPCEFQRQVRSIKTDLMHFKGSELRSFLLYFGPFIFKKYLPNNVYDMLQLLHFSYYVFSSDRHVRYYTHANRCLEIFVKKFKSVFGSRSLSYNVHALLHLHEFVLKYGPLPRFSAFMFESYLGRLKRRVKVTRFAFPHIVDQIQKLRGSLPKQAPSLKFSAKSPNNVAIVDGKVVFVKEILSDGLVKGKEMILRHELFLYPYASSVLGIGHYALTKKTVEGLPTNKALAFPVNNEFVIFPFA